MYNNKFVKKVGMSRNRWLSIRKALHFVRNETNETDTDSEVDENYDRTEQVTSRYMRIHGQDDSLHKVRPILEEFRKQCRTIIVPSRDLYFDEFEIKAHHRAYSRVI